MTGDSDHGDAHGEAPAGSGVQRTTHVISTAIMGVGATRRLSAVRWGIAGHIVAAWIFTFPGTAAIGAVAYYLIAAGLHLLAM